MSQNCHLWCEQMGDAILHSSQSDGPNKKDNEDNVWKHCRHLNVILMKFINYDGNLGIIEHTI